MKMLNLNQSRILEVLEATATGNCELLPRETPCVFFFLLPPNNQKQQ